MKACECGGDTRITNSRRNPAGLTIRRRVCRRCGRRCSTIETPVELEGQPALFRRTRYGSFEPVELERVGSVDGVELYRVRQAEQVEAGHVTPGGWISV